MDNSTRRQLLDRARASGFPGSILDVYSAYGQGRDLIQEFVQEQQAASFQPPMQVAQTPEEQEQGLRPAHEAGNIDQSMAFPNVQPGESFNTMGMKVPINIDKIDNQGNLVESFKAVPPGIQNLPTGPYEGTVIESPARMMLGGAHKYQTAGPKTRIYEDLEEFNAANKAYNDSLSNYLKDKEAYESASKNYTGTTRSPYDEILKMVDRNEKAYGTRSAGYSPMPKEKPVYKKREEVEYIKPKETGLIPNDLPTLETSTRKTFKTSRIKPIMQAAADTSTGQYRTGTYIWDDSSKSWKVKMLSPEAQKDNYEEVKIYPKVVKEMGGSYQTNQEISMYEWKTGRPEESRKRYLKGGIKKYQKAGFYKAFSNPDNLNMMADSYYDTSSKSYGEKQKAFEDEKARVEKVRQNVIPAARQLDLADDFTLEAYPEWDAYISSANPQELEKNRKALPKKILDILPNQGKYNVARWDKEANDWAQGAHPARELYCTPYGCFTYQKAGATDVPIVSGNVGFAAQSAKGELPFEKINPANREAGDIALLVESSPASYIGEGRDRIVRRPHHTTIYNTPMKGRENDLEAGNFYNVEGGMRGWFNETPIRTDYEEDDRIDYYRYVGKTKKKEAELKEAEKDIEKAREFKKYSNSLSKPIASINKKFDLDSGRSLAKPSNESLASTYLKGGLKSRVLYNKAKYKR